MTMSIIPSERLKNRPESATHYSPNPNLDSPWHKKINGEWHFFNRTKEKWIKYSAVETSLFKDLIYIPTATSEPNNTEWVNGLPSIGCHVLIETASSGEVECVVTGYAVLPSIKGTSADKRVFVNLVYASNMTTKNQRILYDVRPIHTEPTIEAKVLAAKLGAPDILLAGAKHMQDRAVLYDAVDGERSIGKTVQAFNAISGHSLTEKDGWLFMENLKQVRSYQGKFKLDNYEDLAAYVALRGECDANNQVTSAKDNIAKAIANITNNISG
jgi:hypothetical protein